MTCMTFSYLFLAGRLIFCDSGATVLFSSAWYGALGWNNSSSFGRRAVCKPWISFILPLRCLQELVSEALYFTSPNGSANDAALLARFSEECCSCRQMGFLSDTCDLAFCQGHAMLCRSQQKPAKNCSLLIFPKHFALVTSSCDSSF